PATGRPSIYDLREPAVDLGAFLDEHVPLPHDGRVLDAGCGPGLWVRATLPRVAALVALDIAHGRLPLVDARAARLAGDIQNLPFRDDAFDAVMAMHMLYHVPDIRVAL